MLGRVSSDFASPFPFARIVARVAGVPNGHGPAETIGTLAGMTTDQKGAIAETAIVHAATRLGISVSRPISPQRYDLIFDLGTRLVRVQCKWAVLLQNVVLVRCYRARRGRDKQVVESYTIEEIDAVAAYCHELDRSYYIPFDRFPRRRSFHLRLAASRNNQRRGVLWADDFDLAATLGRHQGAVAQLGERRDGIAEARGSSPLGSIFDLARCDGEHSPRKLPNAER